MRYADDMTSKSSVGSDFLLSMLFEDEVSTNSSDDDYQWQAFVQEVRQQRQIILSEKLMPLTPASKTIDTGAMRSCGHFSVVTVALKIPRHNH